MSLIKRAAAPAASTDEAEKAAARVREGAPDHVKEPFKQGKRVMFQVGYEQEFIDEIDRQRGPLGLSRPAIIRLALTRLFKEGL